jgi:hypothetical protein
LFFGFLYLEKWFQAPVYQEEGDGNTEFVFIERFRKIEVECVMDGMTDTAPETGIKTGHLKNTKRKLPAGRIKAIKKHQCRQPYESMQVVPGSSHHQVKDKTIRLIYITG